MFWPPNFLGGPLPEFFKSIYKIQSDSDHVVKFQGDRSRELGERVAKQKKHLGQNISPSGTVVPGGLTMIVKCDFNCHNCQSVVLVMPK